MPPAPTADSPQHRRELARAHAIVARWVIEPDPPGPQPDACAKPPDGVPSGR